MFDTGGGATQTSIPWKFPLTFKMLQATSESRSELEGASSVVFFCFFLERGVFGKDFAARSAEGKKTMHILMVVKKDDKIP